MQEQADIGGGGPGGGAMIDTGHERTSIMTGGGKLPAGWPPYMRADTPLGDSKVPSCGDHRRIAPKQGGAIALTRDQPVAAVPVMMG